jgi:hypothetical protein
MLLSVEIMRDHQLNYKTDYWAKYTKRKAVKKKQKGIYHNSEWEMETRRGYERVKKKHEIITSMRCDKAKR